MGAVENRRAMEAAENRITEMAAEASPQVATDTNRSLLAEA
jgi:hypothetical protein